MAEHMTKPTGPGRPYALACGACSPADAYSTCARHGTAPTFVTLRTAVVSSCPQQLGAIFLGQNRL